MNKKQNELIKKVKEVVSECAMENTRIMFAVKEELYEYDGREFSNNDYGSEEEDNYIWVCFNGFMIDGDMQEMSWSDKEINFDDFLNDNYSIPEVFKNFDAIAVKHVEWNIVEEGVYATSTEEPGGIDTDMYYFIAN